MYDDAYSSWYDTNPAQPEVEVAPERERDYAEAYWSAMAEQSKRRSRRLLAWLIAAIVVILIIVSAWAFSRANQPESTPAENGEAEIKAEEQGQQVEVKTIEEIRQLFEQEHGTIYVNI